MNEHASPSRLLTYFSYHCSCLVIDAIDIIVQLFLWENRGREVICVVILFP